MKVFLAFKSNSEAARAIGVTGEAVRKWRAKGVPAERVIQICEASNWRCLPHDLRPDLYPNKADAVPGSVRICEAAA